MVNSPPRSLNHFSTFRFTDAYWARDKSFRENLRTDWLQAASEIATRVHHYQTYGLERGSDFLMWCATPAEDPTSIQRLFATFAERTGPFRSYVTLQDVLWGLTRPSPYSRARSAGQIDPFQSQRSHRYLVVYPFTKTADWYLEDQETRQSMMNEHIRIGKQYRGVNQLLLYSFGLQDHEFVVVYEADDLSRFSQLVYELRGTESRRYTKSDAPLHTAVYQSPGNEIPVW